MNWWIMLVAAQLCSHEWWVSVTTQHWTNRCRLETSCKLPSLSNGT